MLKKSLLGLGLIALSVSASSAFASEAVFYGKPAAWLFDLIKTPTAKRNFTLLLNGNPTGCTQIQLSKDIECTIHGTTPAFPVSSSEATTALCSVEADNIKVIVPGGDSGDVTFGGETAKSVFGVLLKVDHSIHDSLDKETQTLKSFGSAGLNGMMCTETVPDDTTKPATYTCSISWR